ncbi:MAG: rhodanese-like domain-containing protein [Candidatus Gastranaerophilales bacterium]|nr:rhodanese-like domain-containing protein [Candidatus Gastranaerophilales bacterium]MCM1073474.1 rhodanese-like domain-containing protein [Bacteroides sp.]
MDNLRNDTEKAEKYFAKKLAYTVGPVELKELSEENEVKIIDVRSRADYEVGHIPMAISIPYDELENRLNELNKEDLHVVYCYNAYCHLAAKAALMLAQHQLPVMELCGGFKVWSEDFRFATTL